MHILKFFILTIALALTMPAFSQTDTLDAAADSASATGGARVRATPARKDTTIVPLDESKKAKSTVFKDSARLALEAMPGRAAWGSAMLPGLGQIRNGRWWKVPFIYAGLVSVGLAFEFNNRYYRDILKELQYRELNNQETRDPQYAPYDRSSLISAKDFYRRNRDLSILGFLGVHAINVIDAYVDAKFFRYDITDKLGFNVQPTLMPPLSFASVTPVPAIKFTISL